ncbi:class A beta-lactamase [Actinokineospora auranticolor]|uniref:class A beta-lactamase n=1 Tax=Actinokineospora auranticolor TaxID=155976 RepID=UPI001CA59838|nr:class A beta-lactamase [Actinokineospora auranticolor]
MRRAARESATVHCGHHDDRTGRVRRVGGPDGRTARRVRGRRGDRAAVGHRADERFLACSTHKPLVAGAVLRRAEADPGYLDKLVRYDRSRLEEYAPVTGERVDTGMTVAELCAASVGVSDNTAANLLFDEVGGPAGATAFVRSLGDDITRMDRNETSLNVGAPGDERDTTTPRRIVETYRALLLGTALAPTGRDRLTGWLVGSTTGKDLVRAGLPADWRAGDKSGSGAAGEVNNVAIAWPPGRGPWLIGVYTAPTKAEPPARPIVAEAARIVVAALGRA